VPLRRRRGTGGAAEASIPTRGRALTALALASSRVPPDDALERRLAKRIDARMREKP
jgi:hypothetical protein